MARIKKEKRKSGIVIALLIGIMFFGTIAGGFLFGNSKTKDRPQIASPPPKSPDFQEEFMTVRHNPVNTTILTSFGYQTISYNDTYISVDPNNPLAGRALIFDIRVTNITNTNHTGASDTLTVKEGDTIEVDYTGRLKSGEVFDTASSKIARDASIPKVSWFSERPFYEPLEFIVGVGMMIPGFDDAVVGMKINETKTVEIPMERAYGPRNTSLVKVVPIIQKIPKTQQIKRFIEVQNEEFRKNFGNVNLTAGKTFNVPGTDFNASIFYTTENMTVIEMLLRKGDTVRIWDYPWNSTVISVTQGAVVLEHNIKSGDTIQFPGMPWNTTVL